MIILSEESQRVSNHGAQDYNISAAHAVAEAVRTTLGPKGMDKMLVSSGGDVVITNDGVTILTEMDIDNPAANMIVEVAETQEDEVGDGTTTAVVITGALLSQAEGLLQQDIHPTSISQGYRQAAEKAKEILNELAIRVSPDDREALVKTAATAMTGKGAESVKNHLTDLVVDALLAVRDERGVDTDNVEIETVVGGSIGRSELIEGVIVDEERVNENMPAAVTDANVALFDGALSIQDTEMDVGATVTDPDQLQRFRNQEQAQLQAMVDALVEAGTHVVFVGDDIDEMVQDYLAQEDILAVRNTAESDLKALSRATGAPIVSKLDGFSTDNLGFARSIAQKDIGGDERIFVEGDEDAKAVTLILRGGTEHVVAELERAVQDALSVVRVTLEHGEILPGGGASETEVALQLRDFASSVDGREQLAIEAFADALDAIPRTLAENAGLDPIDTLVELRAKHTAPDDTVARPPYSPAEIAMKPAYYTEIFTLAEVGGLAPHEIQDHVNLAGEKTTSEIQEELASIHYHLLEGAFGDELARTFNDIIGTKNHLLEYCSMVSDTETSIEQSDETLTGEEFRSRVETYVEQAVSADQDVGYAVDDATRWFYRKKHEYYLHYRYTVETDQERLPGGLPDGAHRDYHDTFSRSAGTAHGPTDGPHVGIDAQTGELTDMIARGIIEPLQAKTQAIESATEAAVMVLKIDDIISAGDLRGGDDTDDRSTGGDMGGMGGMM